MAVLWEGDFRRYLAKGELRIEPFDEANLTPNGYDVTIEEVLVPSSNVRTSRGVAKVPPMTRFAVSTRESVGLVRHVAGQLWLRTNWARRGVLAPVGLIAGGFSATLTFRAMNVPSEGRERVAQVVERRVLQIEDDAVDGSEMLQDLVGIALVRRDPVDSVGPDVRAEQRDRGGIHVGGVDDFGPTSFRNQDGVRACPGEGIGDNFAREDLIGNPLAFRGKPRAEVRLGQIDRVAKAVFRVHRRRASFAGDYVDRSNPALPLHPAVLHDDPERGIPPEDRPSDLPTIPLHLARDFQDGDVSDHVERAGKRSAERLRYVNDVFVAPDGHESLAEFPLFRWKVEVHPRRRRDE